MSRHSSLRSRALDFNKTGRERSHPGQIRKRERIKLRRERALEKLKREADQLGLSPLELFSIKDADRVAERAAYERGRIVWMYAQEEQARRIIRDLYRQSQERARKTWWG